jgi:hypothetical protein
MAQRTVYWELPSTYNNGTAIPPEIIAKLVTHIFRDDVEVGVSAPGATEMVVTVDEIPETRTPIMADARWTGSTIQCPPRRRWSF